MWHAKNLEKGIVGDYVTDYGFPANTQLTGTYVRKYDSTLVAPWLWNAQKKVFLSTEDEQSVKAKADYVVDKGIGGTMIWELAGDYQWNAAKGQYETGSTLTTAMYDAFKAATPYGAKRSTIDLPTQAVNIDVSFGQFPLGDSNYPISPKLKITNRTQATLPGGTEFQFDYSTSAPANAKDQSGFGTTIIRSDHTAANNVGGLKGDYNRVSLKLPAWQTLAPGASVELDFVYYLPTSTPSNWTVTFGGKSYSLAGDLARGTTVVEPGTGTNPTPTPTPDPTGPTPTPTPTQPGGSCPAPAWNAATEYGGGSTVSHNNHQWKASWWTKGETPGSMRPVGRLEGPRRLLNPPPTARW